MKKGIFFLLTPVVLSGEPCFEENCYPCIVNPPVSSFGDWTLGGHADYLFWQPYLENGAFAEIVEVIPGSSGSSYSFQEIQYDNRWQSGVRLGFDVGLPCSQWQARFDWTYFRGKGFAKASPSSPNQYVQLTYLSDTTIANFDTFPTFVSSFGNSKWTVDLNVFDLCLEREFYVGHQVTLKPYGGLRALFLHQKINASSLLNLIEDSTPLTFTTAAELSTEFKGVGIVGGFLTTWQVASGFGLYGDLATSLLYGKSQSSTRGSSGDFISPTPPVLDYFSWQNNLNTLKASLDLALGIEWREELDMISSELTLRAGWEEHLYFRQNTFGIWRSVSTEIQGGNINLQNQPLGNLSFQGLVVSLHLTF